MHCRPHGPDWYLQSHKYRDVGLQQESHLSPDTKQFLLCITKSLTLSGMPKSFQFNNLLNIYCSGKSFGTFVKIVYLYTYTMYVPIVLVLWWARGDPLKSIQIYIYSDKSHIALNLGQMTCLWFWVYIHIYVPLNELLRWPTL